MIGGNLSLDSLQGTVNGLFSSDGGLLGNVGELISINAGGSGEDCGCGTNSTTHTGVDSILNSVLGPVTGNHGIAVGEPNPNGGSLADLVSLPTSLHNVTDNLFGSLFHHF